MPIVTREWLSWSQMLCWEKGEDAYYRQYVLGERFTSKEMEFGKKIADGLNSDEAGNYDVQFCKTYLPAPAKREHELKAMFEGVPLLIKMDGWSEEVMTLDEYKTGKVPWTQKRADGHGQITLYAMVIWKLIGVIPKNRLWWIPTQETEDGIIAVTGELPHCFQTERTIKDFMLMYARAKKAWDGINQFCKNL